MPTVAPEVPAGFEQFPGDLEGDKRFAGARSQREQNTRLVVGNSGHHIVDGPFLIVSCIFGAAHILKRYGTELIAPVVRLVKCLVPKLIGRREVGNGVFLPGFHVDAIDLPPVGRVGGVEAEQVGVVLGLRYTLADFEFVALGFDNG